jgi:starch-binding outer membrane protein, SusD/RagB family
MKKILFSILFVSFGMVSCKDYLDRQPLDVSATTNYFSNETEINLALTGVYSSSYWIIPNLLPAQIMFDLYTDTGLERGAGVASGSFDATNGTIGTFWNAMYATVSRANVMLDAMPRGKAKTPLVSYERMDAEARVLRAWAYYHLIGLFGDLPYYTKPLVPEEYYTITRTDKAKIASEMVADLELAQAKLDWAPKDRGRVSKGVALGLMAKMHLLLGQYQQAADAAKRVIDGNQYGLNPKFADLFIRATQNNNTNKEIMLEMLYPDDQANPVTYLSLGQGSRTLSYQSGRFCIQALVDRYECTDGKRIDESPLYDPANPSKNRDSRLKPTVTTHGDTITGIFGGTKRRCVYNIYDVNSQIFNFTTNTYAAGTNQDIANAFGPVKNGMGVLWGKYTLDEAQDAATQKTNFIYMRFAEVLLIYAEAKIELNQVDASVLSALNRVRNRAGQPSVDVAIQANQAKLRQLVRRERAVELANEGMRLFDMRRWGIGNIVLNTNVYGCTKDKAATAATPTFGAAGSVTDLNDIPNYTASAAQRFSRELRVFDPAKNNLFPIPQRELDINKALVQNPKW